MKVITITVMEEENRARAAVAVEYQVLQSISAGL